MAKDSFGKLSFLKRGGATSRVIDLVSIRERHGEDAEWVSKPMFRLHRLNRSFIVKHTLRPWERDGLTGDKSSATKVIIPISDKDLNLGGHSIFVEDPQLEAILAEHLGLSEDDPGLMGDIERLRALSHLPSFDPYLLYEFFRRNGDQIAKCYFAISDYELRRITEFVAGQIDVLVRKALNNGTSGTLTKSRKLAKVLFEDEHSPQLAFLRDALRMSAEEYAEGVFGWKGTLYYNWRAEDCYADLLRFLKDLKALRINGLCPADRSEIRGVIANISQLAGARWSRLRNKLAVYNDEFHKFVKRGEPAALKAFMARAPELFVEMGEDIGRLQHVSSYWAFWTKDRRNLMMSAMEAFELLPDFEGALTVTDMETWEFV